MNVIPSGCRCFDGGVLTLPEDLEMEEMELGLYLWISSVTNIFKVYKHIKCTNSIEVYKLN